MKKSLYSLVFFSIVSLSKLIAQVPNGGFENWAIDSNGVFNPVSWYTPNDMTDTFVFRSVQSCSGNYAMRVRTLDIGFTVIPGMAMVEFPFTSRPTSLNACYKSTVNGADKILVFYSSRLGDSTIAATANCTFKIDSSTSGFTNISFPLGYISPLSPDTASITIIVGDFTSADEGTEISIDQLSFGFSSGNRELFVSLDDILKGNYPNPANDFSTIYFQLKEHQDIKLHVYDSEGRLIQTIDCGNYSEGLHKYKLDVSGFAEGMYHYTLFAGQRAISATFIVLR